MIVVRATRMSVADLRGEIAVLLFLDDKLTLGQAAAVCRHQSAGVPGDSRTTTNYPALRRAGLSRRPCGHSTSFATSDRRQRHFADHQPCEDRARRPHENQMAPIGKAEILRVSGVSSLTRLMTAPCPIGFPSR